jgi:hypothetical protein
VIRNLSLRTLLFPATALVGMVLDGWYITFSKVPAMFLYLVPVILFVGLSYDCPPAPEPEPEPEAQP